MILAIKEGENAYIAFSEKRDYGFSYSDYAIRENIPCLIQDDYIAFFATQNAVSDQIVFGDPLWSGELTLRSIRLNIIPEIEKVSKECAYTDASDFGNALILCQKGKLYSISSAFYIFEETNAVCFGGAPELMESVLDIERALPPKERLRAALAFYQAVGGTIGCPIIYIDTKDKQLKIWNGDGEYEHTVGL